MQLKILDRIYYPQYGICEIKEIKKLKFENKEKEYYVLSQLNSNSTLFIPIDNKEILSKIKKLYSKDEIENIIKESKNIKLEWYKNSKERNIYFQNLIKQDDIKISIAIINLIHTKQKEDTKVSPNDLQILSNQENLLHSSLSHTLNMSKEEVKNYILNILEEN